MCIQKMRAYYVIGVSLLCLIACGNRNDKNRGGTLQNSVEDIAYTENTDSAESEIYENGHVCVSEDGRVTIESGMVPGGGTAPDYWAKWAIIDDRDKKHVIMSPETSYQDKVHSIEKKDGTVYYIVNCYGKASSTDGYEWLQAYKIVGDTIQEVNVADGGEKIDNSDFDVNYCIPNWYFTTNGAGYDWILEYDIKTKNLYVPITKDREILDHYHVWTFNGERFVYMGEQPHKKLHKSLCEYNRLVYYGSTKDYIIRIDSVDNQGLRYASWKRPKTMTDKPDIIIQGGRKQCYVVAPNESCPCDDYRFNVGSFEYVVNYCEVYRGEGKTCKHYDFLLVRQNEKVLIKQEIESE